MDFNPTKTIKSKVLDGVSFTVKVMGEAPRAKVALDTAEARSKQRELALEETEIREELADILPDKMVELEGIGPCPDDQIQYLTDEKKILWAAEKVRLRSEQIKALPRDQRMRVYRLDAQQAEIADKDNGRFFQIFKMDIQPAWIRAGLVSVEGIEVGGKPLTTEMLIENGPRSLSEEIFDAIYSEAYMSDADVKNWQPPSSSGAVEDGQTLNGTASSVSGNGSGKIETVASSSPSQ